MSAELWVNDGTGVNRKLTELCAPVDGVNRKLKELWAVKDGVNRKIFNAYDCKAQLGDYTGVENSIINADGSGSLRVYSTFYDDDPKRYTSNILFTFDDPISYSSGETAAHIASPTENYVDSKSQSLRIYDVSTGNEIAYVDTTNRDIPNLINNYHELSFACSSSGQSSQFRMEIGSTLTATSSKDAYESISWAAGNLSLFGKQIKGIELI